MEPGGPDPEKTDEVMLKRHRVSRIYWHGKFFDYPVSLKPQTLKNMGFIQTMKVGFSYLKSLIHKLPEDNLETSISIVLVKPSTECLRRIYGEALGASTRLLFPLIWGSQACEGHQHYGGA